MKNFSEERSGTGLSWLTLFVSTGTLLCCALPILLVSLGLGATVAAITSSFPALIILSENKTGIFVISACLLVGSAWLMWRTRGKCPVDSAAALRCQRAKIWNRRLWFIAATIWSIGFMASYLALPVMQWLEL